MIRIICRKLLGDTVLGWLDYYRFPSRVNVWGGPFNGQEIRKKIFLDIVRKNRPKAIIETGTYLGTTTEFLARTNLPVFSIEGSRRNYGYAKARLRELKNIRLYCGDSREKLSSLLDNELVDEANEILFFYLDAHWNEDLPLAEEVELIFTRCRSAIVMVDDFKVPDDEGYTYDDYGGGNSLEIDYLRDAIVRHKLSIYFPAKSSADESGMKRGSVVMCKSASELDELLVKVNLLRRYEVE